VNGGKPATAGLSRLLPNLLNLEIAADDNTRKRLLELGGEIPDKETRGPQALARMVRRDIDRWAPIIQAANVRAERRLIWPSSEKNIRPDMRTPVRSMTG
jgi:hypothetical protein